ncbi:hypothetical protein OF829_09290 [Sphingomonas sp. LB-2]|nr:hypothetical protein [Sphingomonas caeni]
MAARLTMAGANLLTTNDVEDPGLARSVHGPAVLIVDEALLADRSPEWLQALLAVPQWLKVIVLGDGRAEGADERLIYIKSDTAVRTISALIPQWQAEASGMARA